MNSTRPSTSSVSKTRRSVIVLASAVPGFFSAGADIEMLKKSQPDFKAMFCLHCQETLNKFAQTPKVVIAAIDGHCVGRRARDRPLLRPAHHGEGLRQGSVSRRSPSASFPGPAAPNASRASSAPPGRST